MFTRKLFTSNVLTGGTASPWCAKRYRLYCSTNVSWYRHDVTDSSSIHDNTTNDRVSNNTTMPGSRAFLDCELFALVDLFDKYALPLDTVASNNSKFINRDGLKRLMNAVGESPTEEMLQKMFEEADTDDNGVVDLDVSCTVQSRVFKKKIGHSYKLPSFFVPRNFCQHLISYWVELQLVSYCWWGDLDREKEFYLDD
jgi:hypothetical protein